MPIHPLSARKNRRRKTFFMSWRYPAAPIASGTNDRSSAEPDDDDPHARRCRQEIVGAAAIGQNNYDPLPWCGVGATGVRTPSSTTTASPTCPDWDRPVMSPCAATVDDDDVQSLQVALPSASRRRTML
jgi:hypothetical protein